jgi:non-specific serine/threonine protein kinase
VVHFVSRLSVALQPEALLTLERDASDAHPPGKELEKVELELERAFSEDRALFLLRLGLADPTLPFHPTLRFWHAFALIFPRRMLLLPGVEASREKSEVPLTEEEVLRLLADAPPMSGSEYLDSAALHRRWEDLHRLFRARIADFPGSVEDWFNSVSGATREIGRIHFHLVENRQGDLPFAFLATYGSRVGSRGRTRHLPLRHALEEFGGDARKQLQALKSIHQAAQGSPWLKALLDSGDIFHPLSWTPTQAHRFLKDVEIFTEAGILCRIPDWWRGARQGPRMRLVLGDKAGAGLGMQALLEFRSELILAGEALEEAELRRLAEAGEELAFIKGRWVAVDAEKIGRSLELFRRALKLSKGRKIPLGEALKLLGGTEGTASLGLEGEEVETSAGAWLADLMEKMRNPSLVRSVRPGASFRGKLRPYQQLGLNWLHFLHHLGFGACLADDMGLGKTVQVLALLQTLKDAPDKSDSPSRSRGAGPRGPLNALLVAPASLLHNWVSEFGRFTPGLKVHVAHPAFEKAGGGNSLDGAVSPEEADAVLTTYGMVDRLAWIKKREWNLALLDEAQAIKNPASRQTRAMKSLQASRRIILTGTPVENRLTDLWSLFDFLNPGLLGNAEEFRTLTRRLQDHPEGYGRLRKVVQPYILRRLKTDKSLLPDLPEKVERKVFAPLEKKQVALYRALVRKLEESLEGAEGIRRRGMILAFLTRFKQVCNHPDHYAGAGGYREADSGKFAVLREICEPILEKHERMLLFTQYAEIAEPLAEYLEGIFGRAGLVLTGSTPVGRRRAMVEAFQGEAYVPFMVLSLKAGGTGLNLTRANHVVHFDRWWNPAVENQATDRAFRMGQTRNVMVHKLITRGTLEEKIDALIESKARLAQDVLASGNEDWITEMSDAQIVRLFTLDAVEE